LSDHVTTRRSFLRAAALATAASSAALPAPAAQAPRAGTPAREPVPPPIAGVDRYDLRFRQIHLDFHTSPLVEGIGASFDADEFAATLARAHVNSVTCFGRCHHGYIYYDTKRFPERRHPHLQRNLLREQIDACHARNIRVPVYITIQWDQFTADAEPGWRQVTEKGELEGIPPYEPGFRRRLCLNSPYVDFLKQHLAELFELVPVDGLFLDIVAPQDCSCARCLREMASRPIDARDGAARQAFGAEVTHRFQHELSAYIRSLDRKAAIFYNGGHVGTEHRRIWAGYSHFELESLPSGGWGYMHFPVSMRYARTLGLDCLGMTGKFHTSWGDFHSLKNRAALEFECFQMLALGAKCSVGDQLHPSGRLDGPTYDLVRGVFEDVERKEPWCASATAVADIGVFAPEEFVGGRTPPAAMGVTRMLQEAQHQFDFIDTSDPGFGRYKLLVLPDEVTVTPGLASRLADYVDNGRAILASYRSGLTPAGDACAVDALGFDLVGEAPFSPDFIRARPALAAGLPEAELVMYLKGLHVRPREGTEVLADVVEPYFNRTWDHYFSHRHAPSTGRVGYPGALRRGRAIYFAHPVFTQYSKSAPRWCKQLVLNAIDLLLPEPTLRVSGPSSILAAVNRQPTARRLVVHLLHYIPERRGTDFDTIEDVIPVRDVKVDLKVPSKVKAVDAVPERRALAFEQEGSRVSFTLPELAGHQIVAITL
jgi:hypothetical protein